MFIIEELFQDVRSNKIDHGSLWFTADVNVSSTVPYGINNQLE